MANDTKSMDRLEEVAERIYTADIRIVQGREADQIARLAFQKAAAFCEVAAAVRNGEEIRPLKTTEEPLFALVCVWDGSKGQHGEVARDDNGKELTEIMPIDRWSFAANLPEGHPVNQRYLPYAVKNRRVCDQEGNLLTEKQLKDKGLLEAAANN